MLIKNGLVFTDSCLFEKKDILISKDKISRLEESRSFHSSLSSDSYDASDCYIIPGLTDIHFHGCMGYDFCDGTDEALEAITTYELSQGITTICPATMTLPEESLLKICQHAANYTPKTLGATICGINLEGPFLSYAKKGAQNPSYLRCPDQAMLSRLLEVSNHLIKLVAIAPEEAGAYECISAFKNQVSFSIAHTTADYATSLKAFEAGANHVTHLYNAMPAFSHRAPGVIGAAFDTPHCMVELICDGIHIHPSVVRSTFKLFGDDRVILISDSMMACGMPSGTYSLGGQAVTVTKNLATLKDGAIAGSATHLMDCLRIAISIGIPIESAIKAATLNPARAIGIEKNYGSITPGKIAHLVILKKDLSIKDIFFSGILLK